MALKFLNKKGWHTGSLRNLETVWKAEQKHEAEQKKLEELKVQIHKEREAEDLRRQLHVTAKQERVDFLYDSGLTASSSKPSSTGEQSSSVKAVVEPKKKDQNPGRPEEKFAKAIPGALFTDSNTTSANDKWRKIHSDPLFLIKQQELAALDRIRKNPVRMQALESQLRDKLKAEKDNAEVDGDEKKRHKKRDREDRHLNRKKHGDREDGHLNRKKHGDRDYGQLTRKNHGDREDGHLKRKEHPERDDGHLKKMKHRVKEG